MYQRQYLKTEPQTTAHLAQTMSLLKMNNGELIEEIEKLLNENPAVERVEESRCPQCNRKLTSGQICPKCSQPKTANPEDSVVFLSPRSEFQTNSGSGTRDDYETDDFTPDLLDLPVHILRQIQYDLSDEEKEIAAYMITQIDDDGFLKEKNISIAQFFHKPIAAVQKIRNAIMHVKPIGVGAETPQEAMLIQLEILRRTSRIPNYYEELLKNHIEALSKKDYRSISKVFDKTESDIREAARFFHKNLNPYPARASWGSKQKGRMAPVDVYKNPDVIVRYLNNDSSQQLVVEVIVPYGGNLQINKIYKNAMQATQDKKKKNLKPDFEKANLFLKCMQQRNNTMRRLMEKLAKYQSKFIRKGEKFIIPITRAELADELDVHESTVSRAVANKSLQLPDGTIIPISKFFDRSLGVRTEIKQLIEKESRNKPLSDSKIAEELSRLGYDIARRTVAKYRNMEGIFPAYMRKKQYNESKKH